MIKSIENITVFRPESITLLDIQNDLKSIVPEKYLKKGFDFALEQDIMYLKTGLTYKKEKLVAYTLFTIYQNHNFFRIIKEELKYDKELVETRKVKIIDTNKKDTVVYGFFEYLNQALDISGSFKKENNNEFIDNLSQQNRNHLLYLLGSSEFLLICLPITKVESSIFETHKNGQYYFIQTSERRLILINTGSVNIEVVNISEEVFEYKDVIGKDQIFNDRMSFYTEFFNDKLFLAAKDIITSKQNKPIALFADVLAVKNNIASNQASYIKALYQADYKSTEDFISKLKQELITVFPKRKFDKEQSDYETVFSFISNQKDSGNYLLQVFEDWDIKLEEQVKFLDFLRTNEEHINQHHIAEFYTNVFNLQSSTKKGADLDFKLNYVNHLKETKQFEKAISLYEILLAEVEEDNIMDIISDSKINILDGTGSNQLRIELLESLACIKEACKKSSEAELIQLAILQPLSPTRISNLKAADNPSLVKKATVLEAIFSSMPLMGKDEIPINTSFISESKEELFESVLPNSFKKKKDFLQTITNLIAQIDPPDYSSVLDFSEKVTEQNNPILYNRLQAIAKTLFITNIEYFIGRGNYASGVIGVEGETNFLIIGNAHLDKNSCKYLSPKELQFSVGVELSHILFEHTRLTSKDIWRGAKNKSLNLAQTLLFALPILGTLGNVVGKYASFSSLNRMIIGMDRVSNVLDRGQMALEYGNKIQHMVVEKDDKEQNLLVTSRIMEISADRVGLLANKDLVACVIAVFKADPDFETIKAVIEKNGILYFLKAQNDKLEYLHQSYIIRLKMLLGFYLSHKDL